MVGSASGWKVLPVAGLTQPERSRRGAGASSPHARLPFAASSPLLVNPVQSTRCHLCDCSYRMSRPPRDPAYRLLHHNERITSTRYLHSVAASCETVTV